STLMSKRLRLNPGEHVFALEYESPVEGDAQIRLLWKGREFAWESIAPTYFSHNTSAELTKATVLRQGRELTASLNCVKCHSAGSLDKLTAMPEILKDVPSLANAGNRFNESWMAAWIQNPQALRPQASMPSLLKHASLEQALKAGDHSASHLAAYLATRKTQAYSAQETSAALIKEGGHIFHSLACVSCHTRPEKKSDGVRLPLNNISWKFKNNAALADFLANPAKHYQWIKMPDFSFNAPDAMKVAAYLMNAAQPTKQSVAHGDAVKGKLLYKQMNCSACHEGDKATMKTPLADLKNFSNSCSAADFKLSAEQNSTIEKFVRHELPSLQQHSVIEFSQRQTRQLNCNACHQADGISSTLEKYHHESKDLKVHAGSHFSQDRPLFTWMGEKLQSKYLQDIIGGKLNIRPRPWLATRMPAFKVRAKLLGEGLAATHGLGTAEENLAGDKTHAAIGKKLSGTAGFACVVCHDMGATKALAAFEVKGIDLMLAKERLRPEYFLRWMLDPARVVPHTKMPKYANDGTTAIPLLDSDAEKQFKAIWEFLKQGRKIEAVK
ncbi:MAG: c-type cytochrome, partial [Lentisphaeraceae bacterium]|nr:c-type cytochrome [Lentisphaeraceae bacterium]